MASRYLPEWLTMLVTHGAGRVVIVPGGGLFADQVRRAQRQWNFNDTTAHKMALRAMEQYGLMLLSLQSLFYPAASINAIYNIINKGQIPIWFPYHMVADNSEIEATWEITSDSLSLWLAETLNCRNLIIVKSTSPRNGDYSAKLLSENGFLDKAFADMVINTRVKTYWLSHEQLEDFSNLLNSENYPSPAVAMIKYN